MNPELFSPCSILRHSEALTRILKARVTLRLRGWKKTLELASQLSAQDLPRHRSDPDSPLARMKEEQLLFEEIEASLWRVSRLIPGTTCIHRALAAQEMLYRRRFPARLIVGLRRNGAQLEGHAWLEVIGDRLTASLFWSEESGYQPLKTPLPGSLNFR